MITKEKQDIALLVAGLLMVFFVGLGGGFGFTWALKVCPPCQATVTYVADNTTTTTILAETTTTLAETTTTVPETTTTTSTIVTGSTIPTVRINPYTGELNPEDAQMLLELAKKQLMEQTTTTTIHRISSAAMYGSYNPDQMDSYGLGQFYVNKSISVRFKTVDGSGRWSESLTFKMFNVEQAEARAYLNDWLEGDETVEGVYRQFADGSMSRVTKKDYFNYKMG